MQVKEIENFLNEKNVNYKIWDFDFSEPLRDPNYIPSNEPDNVKWLQEIYKNILLVDLPENDKGLLDWLAALKNGTPRGNILEQFRNVAIYENKKAEKIEFSSLLDEDDEGKRLAVVMPESAGDVLMITSLLPNIKKQYPEFNIYFITKNKFIEIVEGNPFVHKVIPYIEACDNLLWLEGRGTHKGFFEIAFLPHIQTQRVLSYMHNGITEIQFDILDN